MEIDIFQGKLPLDKFLNTVAVGQKYFILALISFFITLYVVVQKSGNSCKIPENIGTNYPESFHLN